MHQINLIEKYHLGIFKNLKKHNRLKLSVVQILNKYVGFEGQVVLFSDVDELVNVDEFLKECTDLKPLSQCRVLHIFSGSYSVPTFVEEQAIKLGYDVGVCVEDTAYSSIFHEVIFGGLDELAAYKDFLNKFLLFQDKSLAENYVDLHDEFSRQGRGVEDWMEMTIYEIWQVNDYCEPCLGSFT